MKNIKNLYCIVILLFMCSITYAADCQKNYLTANGNKLYDSKGQEVFLRGVNWFGFETAMGHFHGIWVRDHKSMLQQIKDQGFNCIRIPWNNAILTQNIAGSINAYGIDPYSGVSPMNEEEATKTTSLEILDIAVKWCQENDMKIILDNHSREPDGYMVEALWYTEKVSHQKWIEDWIFITERYKAYDAVIAMDINNEPHGAFGAGSRWGTDNPANDWRLAAQECGNAILAANPDVLIMVEGTEEFGETSYWWGGNLQGAKDYPVVLSNPNKLVYSPHEYGPTVHNQEWFSDPAFPANLPDIWETNFNFLHTAGTSPLFFGEFGIKDAGGKDEVWFDNFINYMGTKGHHWTFWCWNPNSGDTGGLLDDQWTNIVEWKMEKIRPHLSTTIPNCKSSTTIPVTSISLSPSSSTLNVGKATTLTASILPTTASNKAVIFASTNTTVATVSTTGTVTALSLGSAIISIESVDGGFKDSCLVTVNNEVIAEYTLSTSSVGFGSISTDPIGTTYPKGSEVTLSAVADTGYVFSEWSGDVTGTTANIVITMDSNKNAIATFVEETAFCTNPIPISLTHKYDGVGDFCWETSEDIQHINSWNVGTLEINGVNIANNYISTFPDKVNGKYNIKYISSVAWAHVDIVGTSLKSASVTTSLQSTQMETSFNIFPNPASNQISIRNDSELKMVEIFNKNGSQLFEKPLKNTRLVDIDISKYPTGSYIVRITRVDDTQQSEILLIK